MVRSVLLSVAIFYSCEKEEESTFFEEVEVESEVEAAVAYEEYFEATVNGEEFIVENPEYMYAEIRYGWQSGIPALVISADSELGGIFIYTCFYDGEGTYTTGNQTDVSYSYFYDSSYNMWENLSSMENPGIIEVTYADDDIVEGSINITGYLLEDLENKIVFKGEFGLLLEKEKKP